jgi:cobalt ECF transporter T component CbiQ
LCPCGCIGKRRKGSFVERTLDGSAGLLRQVMFGEDIAERRGLLQRIDPRVKLLSLLVLLVAAALLRNIELLVVAYAATLAVASVSAVPVGFFVKRVWLFVPIFTGIVVLPATLSIITPGEIVVPLWTWQGNPVGITAQGLQAAGLIVTRVAVSISLVVLLTLTTPWVQLLAALRALGVPRMFVLVVGMAYRYIFLLLGSVTEMYESRRSRTVGTVKHDKAARSFVSSTAGALLGKSHTLSEEVHQAMMSRGFRGDAKSLHEFHLTKFDVGFFLVVAAVSVAVVVADLAVGL